MSSFRKRGRDNANSVQRKVGFASSPRNYDEVEETLDSDDWSVPPKEFKSARFSTPEVDTEATREEEDDVGHSDDSDRKMAAKEEPFHNKQRQEEQYLSMHASLDLQEQDLQTTSLAVRNRAGETKHQQGRRTGTRRHAVPRTRNPSFLSRAEVSDFSAELEHIIFTGRDFAKQAMDAHYYTHVEVNKAYFVHGEDTLVYGKDGVSSDVEKNSATNDNWNSLHGDSFIDTNPIPFSEERLSQRNQIRTAGARRGASESNSGKPGRQRHAAHDSKSKNTRQLQGATLLRCWQRAVHTTSATIQIGQHEPKPASNGSVDSLNPSKAENLCSELGIQLPGSSELISLQSPSNTKAELRPLLCPRCGIALESEEAVRKHFLGTEKVRGCCWEMIESSRLNCIYDTMLQDQGEMMLTFKDEFLLRLSRRLGNEKPMDWMSILQGLKGFVKWRREHDEEDDSEGAQISSLPIDDNTLRAIAQRLIPRYASLPR